MLDSGCCGMAGSFGFEPAHVDDSLKIAELVLLPAVRQAAPDTRVIANGFSCREQVHQGTRRRPQHLAEVLLDGIHGDAGAP
jgi:Fe-S oxidoreductase